jgi:FixJ family two-component response regulator
MKSSDRKGVIAIVDDDRRVLESLGELLESAGYVVRLFDAAEAFLHAAVLREIDTLISDIRMPGMDGIRLQEQMAVEHPRLPVILITARSDIDPARLAGLNNRGVFRKPVDATELINALESAMRAGLELQRNFGAP